MNCSVHSLTHQARSSLNHSTIVRRCSQQILRDPVHRLTMTTNSGRLSTDCLVSCLHIMSAVFVVIQTFLVYVELGFYLLVSAILLHGLTLCITEYVLLTD